MPWLPGSSDPGKGKDGKKQGVSWADSLNATDWDQFKDPKLWVHSILLTATGIASLHFYRTYLRRVPGTLHIQPSAFRKRSLLGKVTSVGDGDNFHLFHTPGGRLAGWGWLRKVPSSKAELKGRTVRQTADRDLSSAWHMLTSASRFRFVSLELMLRKELTLADQHSPSQGRPWLGSQTISSTEECGHISGSATNTIVWWPLSMSGDFSSSGMLASRC